MEKEHHWMYEHIVDTTAALSEINPLYAAMEVFFSGMTAGQSIASRTFMTGLSYLGLGSFLSKFRDRSMKHFEIPKNDERKIRLHDALYMATMSAVLSPPLYYFMTDGDMKKIALGTMGAGIIGFFNGIPFGIATDVGRDLMGTKKCERPFYPKIIHRQTPWIKRTFAAAAVVSSIALTKVSIDNAPVKLETRVESLYEPISR